MTCKKDFERYLECKGDEIDNAAYALAVALLRTHPDQTGKTDDNGPPLHHKLFQAEYRSHMDQLALL